jgi:hypothetical protein
VKGDNMKKVPYKSNCMTFWKRQTIEATKRLVIAKGWGGRRKKDK